MQSANDVAAQKGKDDEMAEALQKWSGALDAILEGESLDDYMERLKNKQPHNVVQIPVRA